jgi:hypothetical protein
MLLQHIFIFQLYSVLEIVLVLHLDMNMISRDFFEYVRGKLDPILDRIEWLAYCRRGA